MFTKTKRLMNFSLFLFMFYLLSCFSLDDKNPRIIDPSEIELSSFDYNLAENVVCPGNSYIPEIIVYDKKGKKLNAGVEYKNLVIKSENSSFLIGNDHITAVEDIFSEKDFVYKLSIKLKGCDLPAVKKEFQLDVCSDNPITVSGKTVYIETALYLVNNSGKQAAILVFDRNSGKYYLRPETRIKIKADKTVEKIYILYPYSQDIFTKIRIFSSDNSENSWKGVVVRSPLRNSDLLFANLEAPGFERSFLNE